MSLEQPKISASAENIKPAPKEKPMEKSRAESAPVNEQEQALEGILKIAKKKFRGREQREVNEIVAEATKRFPAELQERVVRLVNLIDQAKIPEEEFKRFVEAQVRETEMNYMDRMVEMPNADFHKFYTTQIVDEVFEGDPDPEELMSRIKSRAVVSLDLNGLKAVNDLNGGEHRKGDDYLKRVKNAICNDKLANWAKKYGIEYVGSRTGGDEFGVIIKGTEPLKPEVVNGFMKEVQKELWEDEEIEKLIDFDDERVLLCYAGITEEEWQAEQDQAGKLEKIKSEIPKGYKFKGTISAGAATLYDALMDKKNQAGRNMITEDDTYETILQKLSGSLFDTSDGEMGKNKDDFKEKLAASTDEHERMLARLYTRTAGERELAAENQRLVDENKRLKKMAELLQAGKVEEARALLRG